MNDIPRASVKQLAHKIKGFGKHPRMAFFLGAGASRQSGVITASEMIRVFKERIFAECCPDEIRTDDDRERWLLDQPWYRTRRSDYSSLFEQCEPKEIGRQRFIESIVEGQDPSFGYVVLANLIASNYVNTAITTNFDDLIYSACTGYTGIRPIVYAYGVLASEMRITAERPKILKLHGDYLYSSLKNTDGEIAAQDPNMVRQLTQVLSEYGLVVVGYSGGDDSIMKALSTISDKNDLYWCLMPGENPNEAVHQLLSEKRAFAVEIEGFDEMMSEIRQIVGFDISKMFESMQERQDQIIERLKNFASVYSIDILSEIVDALQHQAKQVAEGEQQIKKIQALDLFTKGGKALQDKELETAEKLFQEVTNITPSDKKAHVNLGVTLARAKRYQEAEAPFRRAIEVDPNYALAYANLGWLLHMCLNQTNKAEELYRKAHELDPKDPSTLRNLVLLLRSARRYVEALQFAKKGLDLEPQNKTLLLSLAAIYRALLDEDSSRPYVEQARGLFEPNDWYNLACLESITGNTDKAIDFLRQAAEAERFDPAWANLDPDLELIRDDPRFRSIITNQESTSRLTPDREGKGPL